MLISMVLPTELAKGAYWLTSNMQLGEGEPPSVLLKITPALHQYYGSLHGGAIAGLLDAAIAVAANHLLPPNQGAVTVEMKINFIRPVTSGTLEGRGQILYKGKWLITGKGEVHNEQGELIAIAIATYRVVTL